MRDYREDLPLWRSLAAETGGPVLDVGAGTGRVTLDLAARGAAVVALDTESALLAALRHRATGLSVETVVADARDSPWAPVRAGARADADAAVARGTCGRAAFLRRALAHLEPGGLVAAAVADAMDCFDDEHAMPPPPEAREVADVRYAASCCAVSRGRGRPRSAAVARSGPDECCHCEDVVDPSRPPSAADVEAEAAALDFSSNHPDPPRPSKPRNARSRCSEHQCRETSDRLRSPGEARAMTSTAPIPGDPKKMTLKRDGDNVLIVSSRTLGGLSKAFLRRSSGWSWKARRSSRGPLWMTVGLEGVADIAMVPNFDGEGKVELHDLPYTAGGQD